jgi:hypothetical protein
VRINVTDRYRRLLYRNELKTSGGPVDVSRDTRASNERARRVAAPRVCSAVPDCVVGQSLFIEDRYHKQIIRNMFIKFIFCVKLSGKELEAA